MLANLDKENMCITAHVCTALLPQITGGLPAQLTGPLTLCSRTDLDPQRAFTGALSNLALFDVSLMPNQVIS